MTAFITRFCKRLGSTRSWLACAYTLSLIVSLLLASTQAHAQTSVELTNAKIELQDDAVILAAAVSFDLSATLEDALMKGAPLYFVAEAQIVRSRWYWLDEKVGEVNRTVRISYEPLLRRYRISTGGLTQTVDTLNEALSLAQRGIRLRLGERNSFKTDERYHADFSYKLDTSKLPRLFQLGVTASREFALELAPRRIGFKGEDVRKPEPPAPPAPTNRPSLKEPPR